MGYTKGFSVYFPLFKKLSEKTLHCPKFELMKALFLKAWENIFSISGLNFIILSFISFSRARWDNSVLYDDFYIFWLTEIFPILSFCYILYAEKKISQCHIMKMLVIFPSIPLSNHIVHMRRKKNIALPPIFLHVQVIKLE